MKTFLLTINQTDEKTLKALADKRGFEDIESYLLHIIAFECQNQNLNLFLENIKESLLNIENSTKFNLINLLSYMGFENSNQYNLIELQEILEAYLFQNQEEFLIVKSSYDTKSNLQNYIKLK